MILIDTNVLSEARRGSAKPLAALDSYMSDELFISVVTIVDLGRMNPRPLLALCALGYVRQ